ncbi:SAM-dependent methyltransferase [Actinoplanes auranticolor]|uniref:Methyltransferase domain-containing protein n=1 Tax=Actinoplanes auranticolor TaxID=47988 RepID=A0A919SCS4_9ACTN|nr:class I SAM-dependent methyltransferase [Actinoplanes auranticolor]GIM70230.1 hypothetical protein Aau02nite_40030 [Actinoplanes auranticolor]
MPQRLEWAVELLDVRPDDQILEVGCGPGVAVGLVCQRLGRGSVTAIDRSRTAIERASARNAEHVAAGRARFACLELAAAGGLGQRFDKVFAVNVNLFWTREPSAEIEVLKGLLRSGATLLLCYEAPPGRPADRTVADVLKSHGFRTTTKSRSESLICVRATWRAGVSGRPTPGEG